MGQVKLVWGAEEVDSGKENELPPARAWEIYGTDKGYSHQDNNGGEKRKDDHNILLKMPEREEQVENQRYVLCFQQVEMQEVCREVAKSGQLWV